MKSQSSLSLTGFNPSARRVSAAVSRCVLWLALATTADAGFGAEPAGHPALRLDAAILNRSADAGGSVLRLQTSPGAMPGAVYLLQTRERLATGSPWVTHEPIAAVSNVLSYEWPLRDGTTSFFRLEMPEPAIFRVEPAVVSTGGGEIYVFGQCLGSNGTVRVGGVVGGLVPGGAILSAYRCLLPPMAPGVYDVEWLEGGVVVATGEKLMTFAAVKPGDSLQRLLEPPAEPPASPMKVRNGGMVKGNIVINNANRMGGKKGLNAVNVNLVAFSAQAEALAEFRAAPHGEGTCQHSG